MCRKKCPYNGEGEVLDGLGERNGQPLEEQSQVYGGNDAKEGGSFCCASHDVCLMVLS